VTLCRTPYPYPSVSWR